VGGAYTSDRRTAMGKSGVSNLTDSRSLGCKPKGQFPLPINSHYPFPRVPEGSFECHSCLVMNHIANNRYPHNPKVEGSNPSPATISYL
jgi:hypothetical protein